MISGEALAKIRELAAEVSAREGCYLYDVELVGRGRILRVYIDCDGSGVSVDQCANVSQGLSLLLDVEDLVGGGSYELEVSSPGIERPLKEKWQFAKAVGQTVKIKSQENLILPELLRQKWEGKGKTPIYKQVMGLLSTVLDDAVVVENEDGQWRVPLDHIQKANVEFEFNAPAMAKQRKGKK